VVLFGWLLWWLWSQQDKEKAAVVEIELDAALPVDEPDVEEPPIVEEAEELEEIDEPEVEEPPTVEEPEELEEIDEPQEVPVADDLQRIEGIGPRIAGVLQEAGITTFARLAEMQPGQIEEVLAKADPRLARLARPETWPEQAALATEDQWEALEALQNDLKGGRRA
jgi:predicted flap endonuclease-1-like 5' DNA nuclease